MKAIIKTEKKEEILKGFPWIYKTDIIKIDGDLDKYHLVEVYDVDDNFIAIGYLNFNSKILIRVLSLKKEVIDETFLKERIAKAINLRLDLGIINACRLIFSEGDLLPGLIVDKYNDYLVVQFETLGMDLRKNEIIKILQDLIKPKGLIERSISQSRKKEGLDDVVRFIGPKFDTLITIKENDLLYQVDLLNGQKTGHFFDQRENRLLLRSLSKDKTVLDLCCNSGGFGLNALKGGATSLTAVDISKKALEQFKINLELNHLDNVQLIEQDVFTFLDETINSNIQYDIVVFDPPAFVKNKESLDSAYKGYLKANKKAIALVKPGGYLFTFSCSGLMKPELFLDMLKQACISRNIQLVKIAYQASDHPITLNGLNNLYLKCCIIRVNE